MNTAKSKNYHTTANVSEIRDAGLCMGCGTCESVCPKNAIAITRDERKGLYLPIVDAQLCTRCGLCLKVCPGAEVDITRLASRCLDGAHEESLIGKFTACYIGHACAPDVRYHAASGGITTALLIHALENHKITGALVLGMSETNSLETKPLIARTPAEIIAASSSKYCPAAINAGLRHIMETAGRFAVVGLPCHIHAIRKLEEITPRLREKIVLHLGLFCANNNTYLGTEYFLQQNGISPDNVQEIKYRGEGWPGNIRVTLRDNTKKVIPRGTTEKKWHRRALFSSAFHYDFMIPRCLLCPDQTCELADIAIGDPWLREYLQREKIGKSLVIVRNEIGSAFLRDAVESAAMFVEEISVDVVKRAQNYGFKEAVGGRIRLRRALGLAVPQYGERELPTAPLQMLAAFRYLPSYFSYHRWLWPLIRLFAVGDYGVKLVGGKINAARRLLSRRIGISKSVKEISNDKIMPVNILLIGARLCRNLGGPSLLVTTKQVLDKFIQNAEYTLISPAAEDIALAETYNVNIMPAISTKKLVPAALIKALVGRSTGAKSVRMAVDAFANADIVVDIWGIEFADSLGGNRFIKRATEGAHLLVGKLFRKPVVKYTADLGPFENSWNRFFAKLYLQHAVDFIIARNDITQERLQELGVTTPTRVCPDTAFLLEPQPSELSAKLAEHKIDAPVIGFSVSHMAVRQSGNAELYLDNMANLADYIAERLDAQIVLIPNEFSNDVEADDLHIARLVQGKMARQDHSIIVSDEYTAPQLKGIIGQCDAVVAARYHTIVACLSQSIPVLAVGWHTKYVEVLGLVGQEKYLCAVEKLNLDDLKEHFDDLWHSRARIKTELSAALPGIRDAIFRGGAEVKLLLNREEETR